MGHQYEFKTSLFYTLSSSQDYIGRNCWKFFSFLFPFLFFRSSKNCDCHGRGKTILKGDIVSFPLAIWQWYLRNFKLYRNLKLEEEKSWSPGTFRDFPWRWQLARALTVMHQWPHPDEQCRSLAPGLNLNFLLLAQNRPLTSLLAPLPNVPILTNFCFSAFHRLDSWAGISRIGGRASLVWATGPRPTPGGSHVAWENVFLFYCAFTVD